MKKKAKKKVSAESFTLSYSKRLTVNVGNYQSVSIDIGASGQTDIENLRTFVNDELREELRDLGSQYLKLFAKAIPR
jgi:hypothetical protein